MSDDVARSIRDYLARRRDALNDEVNGYPTPIARCDVQLPALLEARAEVVALLRGDDDALVAGFVAIAGRLDDPEARALMSLARPLHARA
jgi:hypothetical protein